MSTFTIKTKKRVGIHEAPITLSFGNNNVITMVGKNGTGKSLFMQYLSELISKYRNDGNYPIDINKDISLDEIGKLIEEIKKLNNNIAEKTIEKTIGALTDINSDITYENLIKKVDEVFFSISKSSIDDFESTFTKNNYNTISKMFQEAKSKSFMHFINLLNGKQNKTYHDHYSIPVCSPIIDDEIHEDIEFTYDEGPSEPVIHEETWNDRPCGEYPEERYYPDENFSGKPLEDDYNEFGQSLRKKINDFLIINNKINELFMIFKSSYIPCIQFANNRNDLSGRILIRYIDGENKIQSISILDQNLLRLLIKNSSINLKEFANLTIYNVCELTEDVQFQKKINLFLSGICNQRLFFRLKFNQISDGWNSNDTIIWRLHVYTDKGCTKELSIDNLSTGTKILFAIISSIPSLDHQTVIMIDEPESGMHPAMQTDVKELLYSLAEDTGARFIISTHSIFMLPPEEMNSLYICQKDRNLVSKIKHYNNKRNNFCENSDEILDFINFVPPYFFTTINTTGINVIVEGKTDKIYLEKWAELFNIDPNNVTFILSPKHWSGIGGLKIGYDSLKEKCNEEKIYVVCDNDIKKNRKDIYSELSKEINSRLILIGDEGKSIESLFIGEDFDKYTFNDEQSKNQSAKNFRDEIESIKDLNPKTVENFKQIFKKLNLLK